MNEYDVIVIGTGSAGTAAAIACANAGRRVAIVDKEPFGGTCMLRGCDPKKVLAGAAELADWVRRMQQAGVIRSTLEIDWGGLIRFKRSFTEPAPATRVREYAQAGIAQLHGAARFTGKQTLKIDGDEVGASRIVIASGAKPMTLNIPGEQSIKTSTDFLDLEALPERLAFIGGGFIAFEFAHVAARAGARVQILESRSRPLHGFDPDLVDRLLQATRELGIEVHSETEATALEARGSGIVVRAQRNGNEEIFTADVAVHGGGRVADLDDLQLDIAGVKRTEKGVSVNEYLQSVSNPAIYAAGDAADGGGLPLTPVAAMEGEVAAHNVLHGNTKCVDFTGLVSAVYTVPALTAVGLSEDAAREKKIPFDAHAGDMSEWYSSRRIAAKYAAFKVLVERKTGHIIGAHILGPDAEEVANIFSLAIRANVPALALKDVLFAYPTAASDIASML
jgi:glutathione reductase (NADPH)